MQLKNHNLTPLFIKYHLNLKPLSNPYFKSSSSWIFQQIIIITYVKSTISHKDHILNMYIIFILKIIKYTLKLVKDLKRFWAPWMKGIHGWTLIPWFKYVDEEPPRKSWRNLEESWRNLKPLLRTWTVERFWDLEKYLGNLRNE